MKAPATRLDHLIFGGYTEIDEARRFMDRGEYGEGEQATCDFMSARRQLNELKSTLDAIRKEVDTLREAGAAATEWLTKIRYGGSLSGQEYWLEMLADTQPQDASYADLQELFPPRTAKTA